MKTMNVNLLVLFLFVSSIAFSQVTDNNNWDTNSDGNIDRTEFNEGYNESFAEWDANSDGTIDDREFYDYSFNRLDQNRDQFLSQEEWDRGYDNMYSEYLETREFTQYDTDADTNLTTEEYYSAFRDTDYFDTYDTNRDGTLDRDELNEGVFNQMDTNRDGTISNTEYNNTGSFFGDNQTERY